MIARNYSRQSQTHILAKLPYTKLSIPGSSGLTTRGHRQFLESSSFFCTSDPMTFSIATHPGRHKAQGQRFSPIIITTHRL